MTKCFTQCLTHRWYSINIMDKKMEGERGEEREGERGGREERTPLPRMISEGFLEKLTLT